MTLSKQYRQLCRQQGLDQNETYLNKFQQITQVAKLAQKALMKIDGENKELTMSEQIALNVQNAGDLYASDAIASTDGAMNLAAQEQAEQEEEFFPFYGKEELSFEFLAKEVTFNIEEGKAVFEVDGITSEGTSCKYIVQEKEVEVPETSKTIIIKNNEMWSHEETTVVIKVECLGVDLQGATKMITVSIPAYSSGYTLTLNCFWVGERTPQTIEALLHDYLNLIHTNIGSFFTTQAKYLNTQITVVQTLSKAYSSAYAKHTEAITMNKEAEKISDANYASLCSVVGAGVISFVSTLAGMSKFVENHKKIGAGVNVAEDIIQVALDKYITRGSLSDEDAFELSTPSDYGNKLASEAAKVFKDVVTILNTYHHSIQIKHQSLVNRIQVGKLSTDDLEVETAIFAKISVAVDRTKKNIPLMLEPPVTGISDDVAQQIEIAIWAKFFGDQKIKYISQRNSNELPYISWPIANRITALGIAEKLGISFPEYVFEWTEQIEALIKWGKDYNISRLY